MAPKSKPSVAGAHLGSAGELGKEMESIQTTDLEDKLSRSRRRCKLLEAANKHYQEQFEQLEDDRRDVVTYLKRTLEQRTDEIAELQDRLTGVAQNFDVAKKTHKQQVKKMKAEFQETRDAMATQNSVLTGKLNTLEEFRVQKEELLCKFSKLEAKLEHDDEHHKEELYQIDRKNILDKDKLKKDMLQRVNQIAADFRKVSNKQVADTTKRMMRENVSMSVTLTKISEKTAGLVEENRKLKSQYHSRQLKISMLEATEVELVKKNRSHMRIIKLLNAKCNAQELMLSMFEDLHDKFLKLLEEVQSMFKQCELMQEELTYTRSQMENLQDEVNKTTLGWDESEKKSKKMEAIMMEAAKAILECLQLDTSAEPYDKYEAQAKRAVLFTQLLNLLCTATGISNKTDFGTVGLFTQIKSYADHYEPGSLGLVAKSKSKYGQPRELTKLIEDKIWQASPKGAQCVCTSANLKLL